MDSGSGNVTNRYVNALIWIGECMERAMIPEDDFGLDDIQVLLENGDNMKIAYARRLVKLAEGLVKGYVTITAPCGSGFDE